MPHETPSALLSSALAPFAPIAIDSLEFAHGSRVIEGAVSLTRLPRLAEQLLDLGSSLAVRLQGWRSEGKSWLRLVVEGRLVLQCQRCLDGVTVPLGVDGVLQLIAPGEAWPDDELVDDSADAIDAGGELDVLGLIEDEVLLALPIAPRHEQCELPRAAGNGYGSSSFAALAALKKH